jgi:hypothetical protein
MDCLCSRCLFKMRFPNREKLFLKNHDITSTPEVFVVQNLTNEVLLERFDKLVRTERKITHLVLECIAEIGARQLYLPMAYPS